MASAQARPMSVGTTATLPPEKSVSLVNQCGVAEPRKGLGTLSAPRARMAGDAKKWSELALGLVTGIGGFLEVGSIATATQAGAQFGFQLAWVVLLGTAALAL